MKEQLQAQMKEAMKNKDKVRLSTIRAIITAIQYEEIEKKVEPLPADGCLAIIQRELKKRKEEVEFAEKANREDLKEQLKVEMSVIESFLPKQLSAEDIEKVLSELKTQNPAINLGLAMKALKEKFAGQYDSKLASDLAKKILG